MAKKTLIFLLFFILIISNLSFGLQKQKDSDVYEQHTTTVRLVLVDVLANDKDGIFVDYLTIDDFEIYEDGKKVPINSLDLINFELMEVIEPERKENEPVRKLPPRIKRENKFFIIFDSINTIRRILNRNKNKILEKLINLSRAGGEIMVLEMTEKGNAQILQPLTSDEVLISQAINKASGSIWVEKTTDDLNLPKIIPDENPDILDTMSLSIKAEWEYKNRIRFEKSLNSLLSVMNMIKNYPGRKPVLLISSGFPSLSLEKYFSGGIESTVGHSDLNAAKINDPFQVLGDNKKRFGDDIFENLVQFANTHNITFYTMDPDNYLRYIFSDMTFDNYYRLAVPSEIKKDELFALKIISEDTNGATFQGATKYDKFQSLLRSDLHSYYEMSYYPTRKKADGKYHKIKVKVKRPGVKIRFRKGYYDYTEEHQESLLFASSSSNPGLFKEISFQARAVPFIANKDKYILWINMALPMKDLILGGDPNKEFKIIKSNFWLDDEKGANAFNAHLNIPINLSEQSRERYKNVQYFGFNTRSNELKLKSDNYRVIFTIYDEETSQVGTVEQNMDIPNSNKQDNPEGTIATNVFGHMVDTNKRNKSFSIAQDDGSLQVDKYKFYPMGTNEFNVRENIHLFIQVRVKDNKTELVPQFELNNNGVSKRNLSWELVKEEWNKKAEIWNKIYKLNFNDSLPGEYVLKIEFINPQNNQTIQKEIKVKLL